MKFSTVIARKHNLYADSSKLTY